MSPVSKKRKKKSGGKLRSVPTGPDAGSRLRTTSEPADDLAPDSPAAAMLRDVEPASIEELQEILDRRTFTMPYYGTTIGSEDFPLLDPADPDERRLLIEGEHPEYHLALLDPSFEGEIDGVSPRLHIALHEVVANQLWDDDPPQVWQTVKRLQADGHDRHSILHAVMDVVARDIWRGLHDREPFDLDTYITSLNRIGRT